MLSDFSAHAVGVPASQHRSLIAPCAEGQWAFIHALNVKSTHLSIKHVLNNQIPLETKLLTISFLKTLPWPNSKQSPPHTKGFKMVSHPLLRIQQCPRCMCVTSNHVLIATLLSAELMNRKESLPDLKRCKVSL